MFIIKYGFWIWRWWKKRKRYYIDYVGHGHGGNQGYNQGNDQFGGQGGFGGDFGGNCIVYLIQLVTIKGLEETMVMEGDNLVEINSEEIKVDSIIKVSKILDSLSNRVLIISMEIKILEITLLAEIILLEEIILMEIKVDSNKALIKIIHKFHLDYKI